MWRQKEKKATQEGLQYSFVQEMLNKILSSIRLQKYLHTNGNSILCWSKPRMDKCTILSTILRRVPYHTCMVLCRHNHFPYVANQISLTLSTDVAFFGKSPQASCGKLDFIIWFEGNPIFVVILQKDWRQENTTSLLWCRLGKRHNWKVLETAVCFHGNLVSLMKKQALGTTESEY